MNKLDVWKIKPSSKKAEPVYIKAEEGLPYFLWIEENLWKLQKQIDELKGEKQKNGK